MFLFFKCNKNIGLNEYAISRDGLNKELRGLRPVFETFPDEDKLPNQFQSLLAMEALATKMRERESSSGGKLQASKVFKKLDHDHDGYITKADLQQALENYQVPHTARTAEG